MIKVIFHIKETEVSNEPQLLLYHYLPMEGESCEAASHTDRDQIMKAEGLYENNHGEPLNGF